MERHENERTFKIQNGFGRNTLTRVTQSTSRLLTSHILEDPSLILTPVGTMRNFLIALTIQFLVVPITYARGESPHRIFAGTGQGVARTTPYPSGQPSGPAGTSIIGNPFGIEFQPHHVLITSVDDHCVYRSTLDGKDFTRIVGNGLKGYTGDGGPAAEATFNWPHEVRADKKGNLYIADTRNHVIRKVSGATGIVTTLAGDGSPGFGGDGKRGTQVRFQQPHSVVLDGTGGLLVADTVNHRIRRIDLNTGIVQTISGTGEKKLPVDGNPARNSPLSGPRSLAVDDQSIWIAMREGNSIWRIDRKTSTIHHIAGTGKKGYTGDGGPPKAATFRGPKGLVLDHQGRILVVDTENHALRRIDLSQNLVETVLGGNKSKVTFPMKRPHGIAFKKNFGYLIADSEFHRVILGN